MGKDLTIYVYKADKRAKVPHVAYDGTSAAFDITCIEDTVIPAHGSAVVPNGLRVIIDENDPYYMQVFLRSSLGFKNDLIPHAGIIDAGYCGDFGIKVYNLSDKDYVIKAGERYAQVLVHKKHKYNMVVIGPNEFKRLKSRQKRGERGFGSSNKSSENEPIMNIEQEHLSLLRGVVNSFNNMEKDIKDRVRGEIVKSIEKDNIDRFIDFLKSCDYEKKEESGKSRYIIKDGKKIVKRPKWVKLEHIINRSRVTYKDIDEYLDYVEEYVQQNRDKIKKYIIDTRRNIKSLQKRLDRKVDCNLQCMLDDIKDREIRKIIEQLW